MHRNAKHLQRPVRAVLILFFVLSAFIGVYLPFDEHVREGWPLAILYCAFLAVTSIGLARLGRRGVLLFLIPAVIAAAPGFVGIALSLRTFGGGDVWLRTSVYSLYAVGVWGTCLVIRGWWLCFTQPGEPD